MRARKVSSFVVGLFVLALSATTMAPPAAAAISFIQGNYAVPQTPQTPVTVTYRAAQFVGDLNVVVVGWNDATAVVTSVADTQGNLYTRAVGPTVLPGAAAVSQAVYYARNIVAAPAGGNTVTVTFNVAAVYPDIRILEYSGVDPTSPPDVTAAATGNSATSDSGPATANANDLLIGANTVQTSTAVAGAGFVSRMITPDGDIAEDGIASATGSYHATASLNQAGTWVMQMVAFKAAAGGSTIDPSQVGEWAGPFTWPLVAIHASLLSTGRVLLWDYNTNGPGAQVWDPATNTFTAVPYNAADLFCAGQAAEYNGRILVAGGWGGQFVGLTGVNLFDPATQAWTSTTPMSFARWYPNVMALPDGRTLVTSGSISCETCTADTPEVYDPTTATWTELTKATLTLPLYPHMFVLPDGRVLVTGSYESYTEPVVARVLDLNTQTWTTVDPVPVNGGSAAMYLPGKVVTSGLGTMGGADVTTTPSTATTYVLDMTQPAPAWRQTAPMAFPRDYHNLTILPDGNVLVTGGGQTTGAEDPTMAVFAAELWSPVTETWTTMASMKVPRLYHSTALLLPDARVLVAGGGRNHGVTAPTDSNDHLDAEIYSPPYLFKGARPTITSAPTTISYGTTFFVATPDASRIATVSLIRTGSVTHAFNTNQRRVPLTFQQASGGLNVQAPANANLAPPGYYLLFIVDTNGVPSVAPYVQFPLPAPDTTPPTAPSNLTATATSSSQITLSWTASTDDVGVVGYRVERCQGTGCKTFAQVATPTGTTYGDSGLLAATSYSYRVRAADAAGNLSPYSNTASATTQAPAAKISFVQGNYAVPQTPQSTVAVTYNAAQSAGDLNAVVVGWNDATAVVSSIADSKGNVYTLAVGPTVLPGTAAVSQAIYYAKNIVGAAAGGNTVTVKFTVAAVYPDIRILEYSGVDPTSPLDVTAAATGNSTTSDSGPATTTNANDLLVGANTVQTSTAAAGAGFTSRMITSPDGDIAEDEFISATGSYRATATLNTVGTWVMQMAAFKAASH